MTGFNLNRRSLITGASSLVIASGPVLGISPAQANPAVLIFRILAGFLAGTIVEGTVERGIAAISRRAMRRREAAKILMQREGYPRTTDVEAGRYQPQGMLRYVPKAAGAVADELVKEGLGAGYSVLSAEGHPHVDVPMAAFANHRFEQTPLHTCAEIVALRTLVANILSRYQMSTSELTYYCMPMDMYEYPRFDGRFNSYQETVCRTPFAVCQMRTRGIGTLSAQVSVRLRPVGGGGIEVDETYFLPDAFQEKWG